MIVYEYACLTPGNTVPVINTTRPSMLPLAAKKLETHLSTIFRNCKHHQTEHRGQLHRDIFPLDHFSAIKVILNSGFDIA